MRCPYCNSLNSDPAAFCTHCGRDLVSRPARGAQAPRQVLAPGTRQGNPPLPRPEVKPGATRAPLPAPTVKARATQSDQFAGVTVQPASPDAPAPFPPHTMAHLRALESGALDYTELSEDTTAPGSKKVIRILYPRCAHWQQVATLLKASRQYQSEKFPTLIVQGMYSKEPDVYTFNNGQLVFDSDVRLGSQIVKRYRIETGTGFENDATRIVLSE